MINPFTKRARLVAAYHTIFDSESGRIVLADLVKYHGILDPIFVDGRAHGDAQALAMAHAEGQRAVVLRIVKQLRISLEQILQDAETEERYGRLDTDQG